MKTKTTSSLQRFSFSALPLFSFFLFFLAVQPATAASFTWVAGGATGNWGDNANWDSPPTFDNANDFVFNGIVNNISFLGAANRTINGLTFADSFTSAGAYRLNTYSTAGSTGGINRNLIFAGTDAFITVGSMANVGGVGIFLGQSGLGNVQLNDNLAVAVNSTDLTKRLIFDTVVSQSGGDRSITKTGTGAIVLQRANTFSGGVNINEGVVIAQAAAASLGTGAVNLGAVGGAAAATLQLGSTTTNDIVVNTGAGTRTLQNNTFGNVNRTQSGNITLNKDLTSDVQNLNATANGMTLSGVISGAGGINQIGNGALTLSGANTYTGTTTVSAGSLIIGASGSVASSSVLDVASGASLDVSDVTGGFVVVGGQTLRGSGTIVGNTTVNGALQPGNSPGLLTFNNDLTLGGAAVTTMEINSAATRGTTFDAIDVGGLLTYGGTLTLSLNTVFSEGSYSFDLFDFGSTGGSFDTVTLGGLYSGSLVNSSGVWGLANGNDSWTFTQSSGLLELEVVPEPSTYALLALAAAGLGAHVVRRRRSSR